MPRSIASLIAVVLVAAPQWTLAGEFFNSPAGSCTSGVPSPMFTPPKAAWNGSVPYGTPLPATPQFNPNGYGYSYGGPLQSLPFTSYYAGAEGRFGGAQNSYCPTGTCSTNLVNNNACPYGNCPAPGYAPSGSYQATPNVLRIDQANVPPSGVQWRQQPWASTDVDGASPFYTNLNTTSSAGEQFRPQFPNLPGSGLPNVNSAPLPLPGQLRDWQYRQPDAPAQPWNAQQTIPSLHNVTGYSYH